MHHKVQHSKFCLLTHCICVFCTDFKTNNKFLLTQRSLIGFHNRELNTDSFAGESMKSDPDWIDQSPP